MSSYIKEIQAIAQAAILDAYAVADRYNVERGTVIENLAELIWTRDIAFADNISDIVEGNGDNIVQTANFQKVNKRERQ